MKRVGKDGVITVEDGKSYDDELEVVEGKKLRKLMLRQTKTFFLLFVQSLELPFTLISPLLFPKC